MKILTLILVILFLLFISGCDGSYYGSRPYYNYPYSSLTPESGSDWFFQQEFYQRQFLREIEDEERDYQLSKIRDYQQQLYQWQYNKEVFPDAYKHSMPPEP